MLQLDVTCHPVCLLSVQGSCRSVTFASDRPVTSSVSRPSDPGAKDRPRLPRPRGQGPATAPKTQGPWSGHGSPDPGSGRLLLNPEKFLFTQAAKIAFHILNRTPGGLTLDPLCAHTHLLHPGSAGQTHTPLASSSMQSKLSFAATVDASLSSFCGKNISSSLSHMATSCTRFRASSPDRSFVRHVFSLKVLRFCSHIFQRKSQIQFWIVLVLWLVPQCAEKLFSREWSAANSSSQLVNYISHLMYQILRLVSQKFDM